MIKKTINTIYRISNIWSPEAHHHVTKKIISLKNLPLSRPETETKQGKKTTEKPLSDMEKHCNLYTIKYHLFD